MLLLLLSLRTEYQVCSVIRKKSSEYGLRIGICKFHTMDHFQCRSFVALQPGLLIFSALCDSQVKRSGGLLLMVDEEGETFLPVVKTTIKPTGTTGSQSETT